MTARSQRLPEGDIRKVFHLLGQITELGREPARWRMHLLENLLPLVGARIGHVGEHYICPDNPTDTRLVGLVEYGWRTEEAKAFEEHLNSGGIEGNPIHPAVGRLAFRSFTRRRRDMVPDETWYASSLVRNTGQRCNIDDTMYSRCKLPQPGWAHFIAMNRPWGAPPFSPRDRLIVSLLHRELGRLWLQIDTGPLTTLPSRLRQTLDLIFSGYSEKQIATALNVSLHTAHDFCRRLYRHFKVSGRGQLLTNPACRQLLFRPALSPAYYAGRRGDSGGDFPKTAEP